MPKPMRKPGDGFGGGPTLSQRTKAGKKAEQRALLRKIEKELRKKAEAKRGAHQG